MKEFKKFTSQTEKKKEQKDCVKNFYYIVNYQPYFIMIIMILQTKKKSDRQEM